MKPLILFLLGSAIATTCAGQDEQVLFSLDDQSIPWRDNLKLTLVQPKKHPANPIMNPGAPGSPDAKGILLYGTVIKEGEKFRMWYIAWPHVDKDYPDQVHYRPIAYAESLDGIKWGKPNLGLVEFRGSKDNNLVLIDPADHRYARANDYVSVLRDDEESDPARRYKMAYIVYDRDARHSTTVTAVSPDGLRWQLANTSSFTKGHFENTSLVKFQGLYYLTGQNTGSYGGHLPNGENPGRAMAGFFSPDFRHWSGARALNFYRSHRTPAPENLGEELHMGAGLWNRGNVLLGLYGRWYGGMISSAPDKKKITPVHGLRVDLGLVISNDAVHYREPVENFIAVPRGGDKDWDSEAILQAQAFHNTETETLIWYSHWRTSNPFPAPATPPPDEGHPMAVGLLTLRRDGFGYLSKHLTQPSKQPSGVRPDTEASLLTRSMKLAKPAKLFFNVDQVSAEAPLHIALVDDAERPLPGVSTTTLKKNGLRVSAGLVLPPGKPFRIRIQWPGGSADPRFYAMYLGKD